MAALIALAVNETVNQGAGSETVLAKLAELMFLEVVRRHVAALPPESCGWLAGLRDPQVGHALALMHGHPARDWTLEALARAVGMSRSAFADRFAGVVQESPMRYLTRWRMQLAKGLLESHGTGVAQVAAEVGYESEAAFNRAFKKCFGTPPGAWRRARQSTGSGAMANPAPQTHAGSAPA
jgi:transcriptional regulator GlxA family with amidase domain